MNRIDTAAMGYAAHTAITDFKRGWKLNLVLAVSLSLGMLLPMLCLGNINVFLQKFSTARLKDSDHTLVASFKDGYTTPDEIESALEKCGVTFDNFAVSAYTRCQVARNGVSSQLYVYFSTENLLDFEALQLVEGSLNISAGERVCLADESMLKKYAGLRVGDTVTISETPYIVGGIVSALDHKSFIVPLSDEEWELAAGLTLTNIYLHAPDVLPESVQVTEALQTIRLTDFTLLDGEQVYQNTLQVCLRQSTVIIAIGLAAFCFAAINISLILTGKLMQDKRVIGIRMALGAPPHLILFEALTEHLLCYCVAFIMDIGLVQLLRPTYPEELQLVMDCKVYALSFLFGAVMVFSIVLISTRWLKKQKLVTLIERVS